MRRVRIAIAVTGALLLRLASLSAQPVTPCSRAAPRDTDLAVYRAVLAHPSVLDGTSKQRGLVVVREMSPERSRFTPSGRSDEYLRRSLREPDPALIAAFRCAATERGAVPEAFGHERNVQLVSDDELRRTLERPGSDYWREFGRRYPRAAGLVSLSPVAYSADGTAAMLHVAFASNALIGHGEAIVLKFVAGAWYVVDHVGTWVS